VTPVTPWNSLVKESPSPVDTMPSPLRSPSSLSDPRVPKRLARENPEISGGDSSGRGNASMELPRPDVEFRAMKDDESSTASTGQLESRLAGMQRRLDQLAELQVETKTAELDRIASLLQRLQTVNQQPEPSRNSSTEIELPPTPQQATPVPFDRDRSERSSHRKIAPALRHRSAGTITNAPVGRDPSIRIIQGELGDEDERFSIQVQDANLLELLEMLGQLADVNILASPKVQGRVTLTLRDVTVDQALAAIVKSQGFVYERDDGVVYVRTFDEASAFGQLNRKVTSRTFRLNHLDAEELKTIVAPLLTREIGRATVSAKSPTEFATSRTPEREQEFQSRNELVVEDSREVIERIEKIVMEKDVPSLQVMIEATILSVAFADATSAGVDFAALNGTSQGLIQPSADRTGRISSTDRLSNHVGEIVGNTTNLKHAFVQGSASGFIREFESRGTMTVVGTPQLKLSNGQKSELTIGQRSVGRSMTCSGAQSADSVSLVNQGTKLLLQPFIHFDGRIRLHIRPERHLVPRHINSGRQDGDEADPSIDVLVPEGTTFVLGGLIFDENLPVADQNALFGTGRSVGGRQQSPTQSIHRSELILLITPRVVTDAPTALGNSDRGAVR
jgi:type IV pilus assembly protein PilQ